MASDVFSPALTTINEPIQDTAAFLRNLSGLTDLQAQNARLMEENARLREWYQTAMVLDAENKSLRDLLNVTPDPQNRYITARILSDSNGAFMRSVTVSAGTGNGVKKGQAVLAGDGLVGRVVEAGQKISRVLLLTDVNSRVPVLLENSLQHAILAGNNSDTAELLHLPSDTRVENGTRLITSGQGGIFPYGVPVGKVVTDKAGDMRVVLFAEISNLLHVRIIDRPDDPNLLRAAGG